MKVKVELDTENGMPSVSVSADKYWLSWCPSISAFGPDSQEPVVLETASVIAVALAQHFANKQGS